MQQGKALVGNSKKPRGLRVNIVEGNTLHSLESDSRSSNSINSEVTLGAWPVEGEPGVITLASGEQYVEELSAALSESVGEHDEISRGNAQSPCDSKRKNHQSNISWDPLVDSVIMLQSAQDALEREVGKLLEIGKGLDYFLEESCMDMDLDAKQRDLGRDIEPQQGLRWA